MSNEIFVKLTDRFNRFEAKVPHIDAFYKILKMAYTEAEAEIGANFPDGFFTIDELSEILKKDKSELLPLVEMMADHGQVFVLKTGAGESKYELIPWFPGVIEFTMMRFMDEPEQLKRFLGYYQEIELDRAKYAKEMGPEKYKAQLPPPLLRTVVLNEDLPENSKVFPYEELLEMLEKEESFSAVTCVCRELAKRSGQPCKHPEIPKYSCMGFGDVADFVVDRFSAKRLTKEEMKALIKTHHEAGSVFNANNYTEKLQLLCGCCSCCCGEIRRIRQVGNINRLESSNFLSTVDDDTCTGCGECVETCPVEAISLVDDIASIDPDACLGCGVCIRICPVGSLSLERKSNKKALVGDRMIGFGASRFVGEQR